MIRIIRINSNRSYRWFALIWISQKRLIAQHFNYGDVDYTGRVAKAKTAVLIILIYQISVLLIIKLNWRNCLKDDSTYYYFISTSASK